MIVVNYDQQVHKKRLNKCIDIYEEYLGHTVHEWTSHTSINAIFKYFSQERRKVERN